MKVRWFHVLIGTPGFEVVIALIVATGGDQLKTLTPFFLQAVFFDEVDRNKPLVGGNGHTNVTCVDNLVTKLIFPDALLLATYLCGLYIFRYGEPEHLAAVMETVFLSAHTQHVKSRKRRLIIVLRYSLIFSG